MHKIGAIVLMLLGSLISSGACGENVADCEIMPAVAQDSISTMSLTEEQVEKIHEILSTAACPSTEIGWTEEECQSSLVIFDSALDTLGYSIQPAQLAEATSLENIDIAAKLVVIAEDKIHRPEYYTEIIQFIQAVESPSQSGIADMAFKVPIEEVWRLPVEYTLLRPYQQGDGFRRGLFFRIWQEDLGSKMGFRSPVFPTTYIYLSRTASEYANSGRSLTLGNFSGVCPLLIDSPGKEQFALVLALLDSARACLGSQSGFDDMVRMVAIALASNPKWEEVILASGQEMELKYGELYDFLYQEYHRFDEMW
ncbi:hypothetical protein KQI84_05200 [bacterium]|nr:hypothetical protein [bacterium]